MDFQNRVGSKSGAGGVASAQNEAIDRRERLRKLALETIDINKVFAPGGRWGSCSRRAALHRILTS